MKGLILMFKPEQPIYNEFVLQLCYLLYDLFVFLTYVNAKKPSKVITFFNFFCFFGVRQNY